MEPSLEVSFCATNLNGRPTLEASLASIERLGERMAVPYEIVVAEGPSDDGSTEWLVRWVGTGASHRLVRHQERNRGYGRRQAFLASRGAWIVPFDTSLVYPEEYAGLLSAYRRLGSRRMLFSELCAIPRSEVEAVGGWRDLIGGEDVDLYARLIAHAGLIAYPTDDRRAQSARLGSFARQMRYVRGSRWRRYRRMYAVQRDQIVGANYRVDDLMAFNRRKPWPRRLAYRLFFTLAYVGARRSPIRPYVADRNNYLLVREAILSSLERGDFRSLEWSPQEPRLPLTPDEIDYLSVKSEYWKRAPATVRRFVVEKSSGS